MRLPFSSGESLIYVSEANTMALVLRCFLVWVIARAKATSVIHKKTLPAIKDNFLALLVRTIKKEAAIRNKIFVRIITKTDQVFEEKIFAR